MNGPHHSCRQRHVKPYARTDGCLLMRTPGHSQQEIVSAWDTSEHAQAYQRFCDESAYYPSASAALVQAARLTAGERVGDLGCGTGVTTEAVVAVLGESAQVWAVDPAAAMLRVAQARVWPVGVRFALGDMETLAREAAPVALDCIVCSSAAWLAPHREGLLAQVGRALRVGGRFAMSIPSEFVGESAHLLEPASQQFLSTLSRLRSELGLAPPAATSEPVDDYSLAAWKRDLASAGLERIELSVHRFAMRHAEWAAHLGLPAVLTGLLPQATEAQRREFAERLASESEASAESARPWHLLVAWRT